MGLSIDTAKAKADVTITRQNVTLTCTPTGESLMRLSGVITGNSMGGQGQLSDGTWTSWKATFTSAIEEKTTPSVPKALNETLSEMTYPFGAYGWKEMPKSERILFKNATVWTSESEGILKETDVLIEGGKIVQIGKNLNVPNAKTVEATGKHLTAGVIYEHSHIAISKDKWILSTSPSYSAELAKLPTTGTAKLDGDLKVDFGAVANFADHWVKLMAANPTGFFGNPDAAAEFQN